MSGLSPSTPPRGGTSFKPPKSIPHFSLPHQTPKSSRKNSIGKRTPEALKTAPFLTPASVKTGQFHTPHVPKYDVSANSVPLTPDLTPQRSPRHKRKKIVPGDLFTSPVALARSPVSLSKLLPNHSTVGSGRKPFSPSKFLKAPIALCHSELSQLNHDLSFEEDAPESPTKRGRGRPKRLLDQPLATPGGQIITDEKVKSWYGNSYGGGFSSDEESEEHAAPLTNPFLATSAPAKRSITSFAAKKPEVNYDTHLELINHRTGEKKVELLSEKQRGFKPKKIDFSNL